MPSGRTKVIQPFETGVVRSIRVDDGQAVKAGDVLIELDPTVNAAERDHLRNDLLAEQLNIARLRAALAGGDDADYLYGRQGPDRIRGGEGPDYLYGGSDDDVLKGEGGGDRRAPNPRSRSRVGLSVVIGPRRSTTSTPCSWTEEPRR